MWTWRKPVSFVITILEGSLILFSAEWMLDVIGAGATATSSTDWHSTWTQSKEAEQVQDEIEEIHREGRKSPPVHAIQESDFATLWPTQLFYLSQRAFQSYWRNPTYLIAKLMLNTAGGLFIGFTFFKSDNTLQGTQNKLFVCTLLHICGWKLMNFSGNLYVHYPRGTTLQPAPGALHRFPQRLWGSRTSQSDVQLDSTGDISNTRWITVEYSWFDHLFPLLVLDSRFPYQPWRLYLPGIWYRVPSLLYNNRTGCRSNGTECRYRFRPFQHTLFFRHRIVSCQPIPLPTFNLMFVQQWCSSTISTIGMVEVDVPCLTIHLSHWGSPWPRYVTYESSTYPWHRLINFCSCWPAWNRMCSARACYPQPTQWTDVWWLLVHFHLKLWRLREQSWRLKRLSVLLFAYNWSIPAGKLQHTIQSSLEKPRHSPRGDDVQRSSNFLYNFSRIGW